MPFPPFDEFYDSLKTAKVAGFKKNIKPSAFHKTKEYMLGLYEGVTATSSFEDETETVWDCIPIEKQPSILQLNLTLATPQDMAINDPRNHKTISSNFDPRRTDSVGNKWNCPEGTIPMKRLNLDTIVGAGGIANYLKRNTRTYDVSSKTLKESLSNLYASASQRVANVGGTSILNIWGPQVRPGEIFSLSQQWYKGNYGNNKAQTIESGWQVCPMRNKGDMRPHLFIYWTPDDYKTGCYDLEGPGFVQTSNRWMLGRPFDQVSTYNGNQYEIWMSWMLQPDGNWWLYLDGETKENAVGYYPASIFRNGPLSFFADEIVFGGEVTGQAGYPAMGSGRLPNEGYRKAAYQANIFYFSRERVAVNADLQIFQNAPARYQIEVGADDSNRTKLFFGGT